MPTMDGPIVQCQTVQERFASNYEVLFQVLEFAWNEGGARTLYRLLGTTTRFFNHVSLDALWATIYDIAWLLRVVDRVRSQPADERHEQRTAASLPWWFFDRNWPLRQLSLSSPPDSFTDAEWATLQTYARRVRCLKEDERIHLQNWFGHIQVASEFYKDFYPMLVPYPFHVLHDDLLHAICERGILLPNIRCLELGERMSILFSPSEARLRSGEEETWMHLNAVVGEPCASFCETLGMLSWQGDVARDWLGDLCHLTTLQSVTVEYEPSAVVALRGLPLLAELHMIVPNQQEVQRATTAGFHALRRLALSYIDVIEPHGAEVIRTLSNQPLLLRQISYSCRYYPWNDTLLALFQATRHCCDSEALSSIIFDVFASSDNVQHDNFQAATLLADLFSFPNIRHFETRNICSIFSRDDTDDVIDVLTMAWPGLESLRLAEWYRLHRLTPLATRCPNLRYLALNLVIGWEPLGISSTIPPPLEVPVAHRMFQEVVFHARGVEKYLTDELIQDLPAYILSVFPHLKEFVGYDMHLDTIKRLGEHTIRGTSGWIAVRNAIAELQRRTS